MPVMTDTRENNGLGKRNRLGSSKQLDRRASFCHTEYIRQRRKIMDEQADEIREAWAEYLANPEDYSLQDMEDIFQDRDPFEFL
jgi:hypothetical protein